MGKNIYQRSSNVFFSQMLEDAKGVFGNRKKKMDK
jgi:hypothetical protein